MARELSRVFRIFVPESFFLVYKYTPGHVVKCGRVSFLPGMAVFKPFSGPFCPRWYNLSFLPGNTVKSKNREN